jgi:hypothetical protein
VAAERSARARTVIRSSIVAGTDWI